MSETSFVADESGAITVDWVVLTGALVGLGFAATTVVSSGIENLSGDIANALSNFQVRPGFAFVAATAGLAQTALWDNPGLGLFDLPNIREVSFATEVTFSADDEGIIFETGGIGAGIILYQHDGMLYLQAGSGRSTGESGSRGEAAWQVQEGTYTIEGSLNASGGLALYVNGDLVDQSSFRNPVLAGNDGGSIAGGTNSVAVNRGGFNRDTPGHPGVREVAFFEGQTTGDELVSQN
jgi:hypothetical protein